MPVRGGWTRGHIDTTGAVTLPLPFDVAVKISPEKIDVESCLTTLMGEKSRRWGHAWGRHRRKSEGSLVVHYERIDDALKQLNIQWSSKDSGCWYSPGTDVVNILKDYRFFDTDGQSATQAYYVVVFHELVHWARRRVQRDVFLGAGFQGQYAAEELVAELGAKDEGATKNHVRDTICKEVPALVREGTNDIRAELALTRRDVEGLAATFDNLAGLPKEIDHTLERIAHNRKTSRH